ncbi:MAG: TetR/AcrR family transcriptional regulator [Propionibacteriaceae bacterium]
MTTNRDRLIDSTRELLAERGFSATSPRAVMDRSGAGQGSFYHHFVDKADLGRAALERTAADFRADWEDLLSAPGTARERIVSCFTHTDDDVVFGCPIGRLTQDEGVMSEPRLRATVEDTLSWLSDRLREVIQAGVRDGELDPSLPAGALASTIAALLQGCYVMSRATHDAQPFRDAHQAIDLLLGGVSRDPARPAAAH